MSTPLQQSGALQSRLVDFLQNDLNLIVPTMHTDLFESGGMDSMVFVELIQMLDREFGIKVDLQQIELDDFRSVSSISNFMSRSARMASD